MYKVWKFHVSGFNNYSAVINSIYTKCAIYYGIFRGYIIFETDLYALLMTDDMSHVIIKPVLLHM